MNWIVKTLTSSLGRKLIMALTGIFLCLFLTVHLIGNLQLLKCDAGMAFNLYADFMGHNPLIQTISVANLFFIFLHAFTGILLVMKNKKARPVAYASIAKNTTWSSKNMGLLGSILLVFIVIHLVQFWGRAKLTNFGAGEFIPNITYGEHTIHNLYSTTAAAFTEWWVVLIYVISMAALAFHLSHGFVSMFQTLGLNHNKYNLFIRIIGQVYCVVIPFLYAMIPILMLVKHYNDNKTIPTYVLYIGAALVAGIVGLSVANSKNKEALIAS